MNIEQIELYHISQTLVAPFTTSFGTKHQRETILLALRGEGLTAWGECEAFSEPDYNYETVQTAWHILEKFLIPAVLGQTITRPEDLALLLAPVRGHPMAKAALDFAVWDLLAQKEGVSLAQKLNEPYGRPPRPQVAVGVSVGLHKTETHLLQTLDQHLQEGYKRVKLKIKPGRDVALAQLVRHHYPDLALMLDANSAYTLADAPILKQLDQFNLLMVEQPLHHEDIYEHSLLQHQMSTPICLDESIVSVQNAQVALAIQACGTINIKPARVGGLTTARQIHDMAHAAGLPVWCGGMLETGVGRAVQLALASLPGFTLPGDISASNRYYVPDITQPFLLNQENSTITVPQGLGLGVTIDQTQLQKVLLHHQTFRP